MTEKKETALNNFVAPKSEQSLNDNTILSHQENKFNNLNNVSNINGFMLGKTASEILAMDIPQKVHIVEGFISEGNVLFLAGDEKTGKTFFCISLANSVSNGKPFLEMTTHKSPVVMLALESDLSELQERLTDMNIGSESNTDNMIFYSIDNFDSKLNLTKVLENIHKLYPEVKLVIVDTFYSVNDSSDPAKSYINDGKKMLSFKKKAKELGIAVLFTIHLTKQEGLSPSSRIQGSKGLTAASDGSFVILFNRDVDDKASMYVRARGIPKETMLIKFNSSTFTWELEERAPYVRETISEHQKLFSYIDQFLLDTNSHEWDGTADKLSEILFDNFSYKLNANLISRYLREFELSLKIDHYITVNRRAVNGVRHIQLSKTFVEVN